MTNEKIALLKNILVERGKLRDIECELMRCREISKYPGITTRLKRQAELIIDMENKAKEA